MILLSFSGTFKMILVLLAVLIVLRIIQRTSAAKSRQPPPGTHWSTHEPRAKGDVRIEKAPGDERGERGDRGPVEDADFEEVR